MAVKRTGTVFASRKIKTPWQWVGFVFEKIGKPFYWLLMGLTLGAISLLNFLVKIIARIHLPKFKLRFKRPVLKIKLPHFKLPKLKKPKLRFPKWRISKRKIMITLILAFLLFTIYYFLSSPQSQPFSHAGTGCFDQNLRPKRTTFIQNLPKSKPDLS